jgi:hypothetical protein
MRQYGNKTDRWGAGVVSGEPEMFSVETLYGVEAASGDVSMLEDIRPQAEEVYAGKLEISEWDDWSHRAWPEPVGEYPMGEGTTSCSVMVVFDAELVR